MGILWIADSALADVSTARQYRYRPRHAAPSLPVRIVRAGQSRIQALVDGGLDMAAGRRSPRSLRTGPVSSGWEREPTPAASVMSATARSVGTGGATAATTKPLPRVA